MAIFGKKQISEEKQRVPASAAAAKGLPADGADEDLGLTNATSDTEVIGLADDESQAEKQDAALVNKDGGLGLDDDLLDIFTGDDGIDEDLRILTEGLPRVSMSELLSHVREIRSLVHERSGY